MVRRKPEPQPPTPEILALREAALRDVLTALDDLWGVPQARVAAPSVHRKPPLERAEAAIDHLSAALGELTDMQRPQPHRFRRAYELSPTTCIGQDIDEVVIRAVAANTSEKITRLRLLGGLLSEGRASTNDRAELNRLVEECASPPRPPNEWAYVAEAVRAGAEDLPAFVEMFQPGSEAVAFADVDPAPFVAVVLAAMCPGVARNLDAETVRRAVKVWGRRTSRDDANAWDLVAELVQPPMETLSAQAMSRRWIEVRDRVRLDRSRFVATLSSKLHAIHRLELVFAPSPKFTPLWVRLLTTAVRSAMPERELDAAAVVAPNDVAPALPDEFVLRAAQLLRPERAGRRGRPSVPIRAVLVGLLDHLNSSRVWGEIPHGRTIEARYGELHRSNRVEAFKELAREFGLIT